MRQLEYDIINGRDGRPAVRVRWPDGRSLTLNSLYDPVGEAEEMVSGLDLAQAGVVFVLGCGLGYHLKAVLKRCPETSPVVVIDRNPDLMKMALAVHPEINSKRTVAFTSDPDSIEWIVRNLALLFFHRKGVRVVEHQPSLSVDPEFYADVLRQLRDSVARVLIGVNTTAREGWRFAHNFFENLPILCQDPCVSHLFEQFKGIPAILVASGPSLDKNISLIHEAKGKAVIIAAGSAYEALHRAGVTADFVVSVDPFYESVYNFRGRGSAGTCLVYESKANPAVAREFSGPRFNFFQPYPMAAWLARSIGPRAELQVGLTVAVSAFSLASRLGCNPKIIVGQDCAFTGNESYSSGVGGNRLDWQAQFTVPAIGGGTVPTNYMFNTFRLILEGQYKADIESGGLIIDATEGGALKAHTQVMTLREAIDLYCTGEAGVPQKIREIWESRAANPRVLTQSTKAARGLARQMTKFRDQVHKGLVNIQEFRRLLESFRAPHMAGFRPSLARRAKDVFDKVWEDNQEINRYPELVELLQLTLAYMRFGRRIENPTAEEKIEENAKYYAELLAGCDLIIDSLNQSVAGLEEIAKPKTKGRAANAG